jgi:hypothetical protein
MKLPAALILAAALAGCAAERPPVMSADEEDRLAAELRDYRQDGPAVACVSQRDLTGNRSVGEGALIFSGHGGRLWVNRPPAGCPALETGRALVTRTTTTRLCRGDIASVVEPTTGMGYGGCGLGDFTPYRRVGG